MLRKTLYTAAALLLAIVLAVGAAVWYAKPTEALDLAYEPVSIAQKALDMVKARKLEVRLSERDLNDLLKKQLAEHAQLRPNVTIEGARFEQHGNRITAYVNLKAYGGVAVGAAVDFTLAWRAPELIVSPTAVRVRGLPVPSALLPLEPIVLRTDESLPPLVAIKDVRFEENGITVAFQVG